EPGDIASRPRQSGNQTFTHRIGGVRYHDGDNAGSALRCRYRRPRCSHDEINLKTNQVGRKLRQALRLLLGKPVLDGDILSLYPAKLAQLLAKRLHEARHTGSSA